MSKSFKLIINSGSGHDEKETALSVISDMIAQAGHQLDVFKVGKSDDILKIATDAVLKAKSDNSIVVAAGGDGSINAVAGLCYEHNVPMGVIPMGTFNFFARDHHIPVDVSEAVKVLLAGELRPVPVATINGHIFLVHAGIGLYSEIMRNREKDKQYYGRYRIVAFVSSFMSLMRTRKIYTVTLKTGTDTVTRQTLNIFVGNNTLQLEKLGLTKREDVKPEELAIIILKPATSFQRVRLAFWGLVRQMKMEPRIESFIARDFVITTKEKAVNVAIDGELISLPTPLEIKSIPDSLRMIVPTQDMVS